MNLHKNLKEFEDAITYAANDLNTSAAIIEKDYYVTLFLKNLAKKVPNLLFKGGTSLSKCYKLINRFSEDIDLTLDSSVQSKKIKKQLKNNIIEVCQELNFKLINEEDIKSGRNYNRYEIEYNHHFEDNGIKPYLLVETVFIVKSYPFEIKKASSMIYDFLEKNNNLETIKKYQMSPFDIKVQSLNRTLIDKVFALCDYVLLNKTEGHSRHIYDLYKILEFVPLDNELKKLVLDVREDRKQNKNCISAQNDCDIKIVLKKIINEKSYYKDYKKITEKVLFDNISYETAISSIQKIINSNIF